MVSRIWQYLVSLRWALTAPLLLVAGCVGVPEALQPVADTQPSVAQVLQEPDAYKDEVVVWGGTIAEVTNLADGTRLEVVSRPLGRNQRPLDVDRSEGRFHAFVPGFLDPQVHAPQRAVTVRGTVLGTHSGMIGSFPYNFPEIEAASVYLWPPPEPEPRVIYRDPFWDPWGPPYWYPARRGWW